MPRAIKILTEYLITFQAGLLQLLRSHRQFWVVATVMALVIGTWSGWTGVMPIVLRPLNITQVRTVLKSSKISYSILITEVIEAGKSSKKAVSTGSKLVLKFVCVLSVFRIIYSIRFKTDND